MLDGIPGFFRCCDAPEFCYRVSVRENVFYIQECQRNSRESKYSE